ncbi:MAG: hypothetical protein E7326_06260 [Clostridiales bacterium]|nr:hypothetical protein [Clostridiales bacterium]
MKAIFKRELEGYFHTPVGYVFMGVFLMLGSIFFGAGNLAERSGNMTYLLRNMSYLWMLLCPVLTMRLFAGERVKNTDVLWYASPVSMAQVVGGKFLSALLVMLLTVVCTFVYPLLVAIYGKLYLAETLVAYLGFILQGGCFIALDMAVTASSRSQVTAAIWAFGVNLIIWLSDAVSAALGTHALARVLAFFSLNQRFTPFAAGQLSFANMGYALIFMAAMLFVCVRVLDARRYGEV